jgi:hypothetical protein
MTKLLLKHNQRKTGYIVTQLQALGVPRSLLYLKRHRSNGSFWLRRINHLAVLERARQLYRAQVLREHPDKGGCHKRTAELNSIWRSIKQTFTRHGYEI